MDKKLTQAEWVIVGGGVVAFLASFLPWVDIDTPFGSATRNAWSDDVLFPTYAWVGIFGLVMAAVILLRTFANVRLPSDIVGFTWTQVHLILAVFAAILAVSFLIGGSNFGIGFWLSLLAAAALVVGAVMLRNETASPSAY